VNLDTDTVYFHGDIAETIAERNLSRVAVTLSHDFLLVGLVLKRRIGHQAGVNIKTLRHPFPMEGMNRHPLPQYCGNLRVGFRLIQRPAIQACADIRSGAEQSPDRFGLAVDHRPA
jgi:hypothetical protein